MKNLKLVTFEEPIFSTIQGEGILVGTPSVFIRTYGCDYACHWCDTKGSWRPGSTGQDVTLDEIVTKARSFRLPHAVITGGNPLLWTCLPELIVALQTEYRLPLEEPLPEGTTRGINEDLALGMHVTVETQASIFDEAVARHVDLMSISPKLHDWRQDVVDQFIDAALMRKKVIQVKIVCTNRVDADIAIQRVADMFSWACRRFGSPEFVQEKLFFILQPETSLGRPGIQMVRSAIEEAYSTGTPGVVTPLIRLIPQVHKTGLYVR